jgi:hypothetical protein
MKKQIITLGLFLLAASTVLAMLATGQAQSRTGMKNDQKSSARNYTLSGPYAHENLTIFLIHGEDQLKGAQFLTLQEAMEQKKVVLHETSNVNELAIENLSSEEVYVQSGDIVKGGKQDRVLAYDFIVPPHSGRMPIAAFCVEQGRWSRRGAESAAMFSTSTSQLNSKDLKIAAKRAQSQREVWSKVAESQERLGAATQAVVVSADSASSLQLTLENSKVKETAGEYLKKLSPIIEGKKDVIGYAFAINGRLNSADVYASGALFRKLWRKLLEASAIEAIAERRKDKQFEPATVEAVQAALAEAEQGRASEKEVTKRIKLITLETDRNIFFETRDRERREAWIHRNYLTK